MEDFIAVVLAFFVILVVTFTAAGITHVVADYRHFGDIVIECKQNGRIQDETRRILCSVEENQTNKSGGK